MDKKGKIILNQSKNTQEKVMAALPKKKLNKNLNLMKQTNHDCVQLLEHLKTVYVFTTEEEKAVKDMQDHMFNMSSFFDQLQKSAK